MPRSFIERRHDFREAVDDGTVGVGPQRYRLVNWSVGGFLAEGAEGEAPAPVGAAVAAAFDLRAGRARFAFEAGVRIVRVGHPDGCFAGQFERLDPAVRDAIRRHFNPFGAAAPSSIEAAYAFAHPYKAVPPPPPAEPDPLPAEPVEGAADLCVEWSRNTIGADAGAPPGDGADLRRQLARLKAAVARRYHPDATVGDQERGHRAEIFARVWAQLEEIEAGLAGGGPAEPGGPERGRLG